MTVFRIQAMKPATRETVEMLYDNQTSSLVNASSGLPVVEVEYVANQPNAPTFSRHEPAPKSSPRTLKISLGLSCNYECEYCSQRFVPRAIESNPGDVDAFMAGLDAWVKQPPARIEFWGGEPLVYIKTLKPLAEALKRKFPSAGMNIISNGSLLSAELNEWIDSMGFTVGISHDGPGQHVRGPDPLDEPIKREAILGLYRRLSPQGRISFNAMINRQNPSRAAIQEFFQRLTGDQGVPIGEGSFVDAYDEGGIANSLRPEEAAPFRNLAFHEIRTGQASGFHTVGQRIGGFVQSIKTGRHASKLGQKCGMDSPEQIAVDLRGNVLTCQNVSAEALAPNGRPHKIGHVSDMGAVALDTARHWSNREECPQCPVLQICKGSCMFLEGDLWDSSCNNAFSDAIPIFAAGIEFLTGYVPMKVIGPHRADRHDIWEVVQPVKPARKVIPIAPVAA